MPSPFSCSLLIRECLWKKTQIEERKSWERVDARGKNTNIFKAKERKQYENDTENLFLVIMCLIEAFKMGLLTIAESFESTKRSNSTFKWLAKFLKDELMLDMSMKRDLQAFSKLGQHRKKCSLSSTSKLQLNKGFKVSRKPCLNLHSFKWLEWRHNLVKYLTPSGSLTLNIDLLLGLIKERSLLLKTTIDSEFCIPGSSCNHSDREFGKKEYLKQWVLQLKVCFLHVS